ncbi:MAG: DUF2240 family protein [Nanohaloarchaea archaeon]|nr:DUF2240 family protein [Candidatus Nanohaloarchaea archaeon]
MNAKDVVEKIVEETDLSKEDVKEEVEAKTDEFEGLVSEEGAVHLVAKDNGVQIAEAGGQALDIENIVPDMRKVNLKARVTNIMDANTFERDDGDEGKVQNMVLGDETGTIRVTLWDEQTEIAEKVSEGDAIGVEGAYTVEDDRGNAELRLGDEAHVKKVDDDEVPEVETGGSSDTEKVDIREIQSEGASYEVKGMIMDVYTSSPFYRVDPETGDTVRENDDGELVTDEGKEVEEPDHRLALSCVVDDGTGNTRVVLFGDQARKLLEIDEETERDGDLKAVENAATDAVGKEVRISGRTRYNDYFGTLELIGNEYEEIEPEDEIEELVEVLA